MSSTRSTDSSTRTKTRCSRTSSGCCSTRKTRFCLRCGRKALKTSRRPRNARWQPAQFSRSRWRIWCRRFSRRNHSTSVASSPTTWNRQQYLMTWGSSTKCDTSDCLKTFEFDAQASFTDNAMTNSCFATKCCRSTRGRTSEAARTKTACGCCSKRSA